MERNALATTGFKIWSEGMDISWNHLDALAFLLDMESSVNFALVAGTFICHL